MNDGEEEVVEIWIDVKLMAGIESLRRRVRGVVGIPHAIQPARSRLKRNGMFTFPKVPSISLIDDLEIKGYQFLSQ